MSGNPTISNTVRPEHLYSISRVVTQASEWKTALNQVAKLVRSFFIFDNLAVYLLDKNNHGLDVMYAKAVGRGRAREADIAWGESLANRITESRQTLVEEPGSDASADRLNRPFMLGIPLEVSQRYLGAIIFIRFGGPEFSKQEIKLAEFIAIQIAVLIERENLQEEYQALQAQNRQNQLQADFISTITHELRSPLGFIKGYATTLLRSDTTWDQETQQEFLQIIDQETDQLQELIENLLDSARLQSGQLDMRFQPVRLDALMNDVILRARLHHPDLSIKLDVSKDMPPIQGSPQRLSQVFENLLSNATKYAPDSAVEIKIQPEKDRVRICVADHGPGISDQYLPFLFNRFFRNPEQPPNIRGTGLGLYICKQIVQAHNGEITATSSIGEGTTFHIVLPCCP